MFVSEYTIDEAIRDDSGWADNHFAYPLETQMHTLICMILSRVALLPPARL